MSIYKKVANEMMPSMVSSFLRMSNIFSKPYILAYLPIISRIKSINTMKKIRITRAAICWFGETYPDIPKTECELTSITTKLTYESQVSLDRKHQAGAKKCKNPVIAHAEAKPCPVDSPQRCRDGKMEIARRLLVALGRP